jgi:hypothetical protein
MWAALGFPQLKADQWFQFDLDDVAVKTEHSLACLVLSPFNYIKQNLAWIFASSAHSGGSGIPDRIGGGSGRVLKVLFASYEHVDAPSMKQCNTTVHCNY